MADPTKPFWLVPSKSDSVNKILNDLLNINDCVTLPHYNEIILDGSQNIGIEGVDDNIFNLNPTLPHYDEIILDGTQNIGIEGVDDDIFNLLPESKDTNNEKFEDALALINSFDESKPTFSVNVSDGEKVVEKDTTNMKIPTEKVVEVKGKKRRQEQDLPLAKKSKEDTVINIEQVFKYNLGDIVYGQVVGFPWWPGLIDKDPETQQFCELEPSTKKPLKFHVTFFDGKHVTRAWLGLQYICHHECYPKENIEKYFKTERRWKKTIQRRWEAAHKKVVEASVLTVKERLAKFSFKSQPLELRAASREVGKQERSCWEPYRHLLRPPSTIESVHGMQTRGKEAGENFKENVRDHRRLS